MSGPRLRPHTHPYGEAGSSMLSPGGFVISIPSVICWRLSKDTPVRFARRSGEGKRRMYELMNGFKVWYRIGIGRDVTVY